LVIYLQVSKSQYDISWQVSKGADRTDDRHSLARAPTSERGREAWIALFQTLEDGVGKAMTTALRQLAW
jgi:hypothetical protein